MITCGWCIEMVSQGPCLAWLNTIEAYQQQGIDLPVNLKFIFEGMEESGSEGLDEAVNAKKDTDFIRVWPPRDLGVVGWQNLVKHTEIFVLQLVY